MKIKRIKIGDSIVSEVNVFEDGSKNIDEVYYITFYDSINELLFFFDFEIETYEEIDNHGDGDVSYTLQETVLTSLEFFVDLNKGDDWYIEENRLYLNKQDSEIIKEICSKKFNNIEQL